MGFNSAFKGLISNSREHQISGYQVKLILNSAISLSGHAVVQLVGALRYKPEDHGFDSRLRHWNFSLT